MQQLKTGSIFENRFEILGFLGGGGMGAVYKAKQLDANRIVAVKLLHPSLVDTEEFRKRFQRECKMLSLIQNEHVITFYHAAISSEGDPYAVFEYMEGETLRQLLSSNEKLSVIESLEFLLQTSEALIAAHSEGIVHRDLKPENIMISKRDKINWVKVFDFGLSKDSIAEERESQRLTLTGDIVGTAAYMSPEQCRGAQADFRSDLYALGCVAYECLAGRPLFDEKNQVAALHQHLNEDPTDAINELCSFCPPALTDLLTSLLAKSPPARPRSADMVRDTLQEAKSQLQSGISSSKRKKTSAGKPTAIIIASVLAAIALCGTGIFMLAENEKAVQKAKAEERNKRKKKEAEERRNLVLGSDLADEASEAIVHQDFARAIELAKRCLSLKNGSCEFLQVKLRAVHILTQASDFSGLANSDTALLQYGKLLQEAKSKKCLPASKELKTMFGYLLLAGNVHAGKNRLRQTIACSLEFERLHKNAPDDEKQARQFFLSMVSRGQAYRNLRQYQQALATDRRALELAKELERNGADEMHSIYPSLLIDCCVVNEDPKEVASLVHGYATAFEKSFNSDNSEGLITSLLTIQDYLLSHPEYIKAAKPLIVKGWKAAEMFPEISVNLRLRALQQLMLLELRESGSKKLKSELLLQTANQYLRIKRESTSHRVLKKYQDSGKELADQLVPLLIDAGQASLAAKVKEAGNQNS